MRRTMTALVPIGLLGTMLLGSARADLPKVRRDSDDVSGDLDLRRIETRTSGNRLILRIGMWDPHPGAGRNGFIVVPMDTHEGRGLDRRVTIYQERCRTSTSYGTHQFIGRRPTRRPSERSISCRLPLHWFEIEKRVRFAVYGVEYDAPSDIDRAPDDRPRMYRGL